MIPLRAPTRPASILAVVLAVALLAAPAAAAEPHPVDEPLACGQEITRTDENGTFHLRFQCLPTQGLLNWGFTFNPQWRAMAISPVDEVGMAYWRNGVRPSDNGGHFELPIDYFFHGTLPGVFVGDDIEYQDFFTFRANFGASTGTARVAIAGSVILKPMTGGAPDPALLFAEALAQRVINRLGQAAPPLHVERARFYHGFDTDAWEMEFSDEPADDVRITVRTDVPADGAVSAHLLLVGSREEAIAAVATHIQGFAVELTHGEALPPCPGHPHPLDPKVHDGIACWICPKDPAHHVEPILPAD